MPLNSSKMTIEPSKNTIIPLKTILCDFFEDKLKKFIITINIKSKHMHNTCPCMLGFSFSICIKQFPFNSRFLCQVDSSPNGGTNY